MCKIKLTAPMLIKSERLKPYVLRIVRADRTLHHNAWTLLIPPLSWNLPPHADLHVVPGSVMFLQPPQHLHLLPFLRTLFVVVALLHHLPRRMDAAQLLHRSHHAPACPCTTQHHQIQCQHLVLQLPPTYCWHALTYVFLWCPCTSPLPSHVLLIMQEGKK